MAEKQNLEGTLREFYKQYANGGESEFNQLNRYMDLSIDDKFKTNAILKGYPSGSYSSFQNSNAIVDNTLAHFPNELWGVFLEVKADVVLEAVRVAKPFTTLGSFVLGIYEVDDALSPTKLLTQTAERFDASINGFEEIALRDIVSLKAGVYCFAYHSNANGGALRGSLHGGFHYITTPNISNELSLHAVRSALPYDGDLPSVFPSFTRTPTFQPISGNNRIPMMAYKIS